MIEALVYVLLSECVMGLLNCLALSFSFSTHTTFFFIHNHTSISSSSKSSFSPQTPKKEELLFTKRDLNFSCIALLLNACYANVSKALLLGDTETELQRYTDSTEGFTLLRPASWIKLEKAGATVLFEQANKGSNNIGVVVNPVRLSTLGDFGTPQFVADKLIQAEKRKESTIDAELIGVAERSGQKGLQVYEFEYKLDSSRGGMKRIFSAAFVASRKLYLLNINYSDKPESPLDNHTRKMLEEILHSFDAAPMT